jgi:hypothetical protein
MLNFQKTVKAFSLSLSKNTEFRNLRYYDIATKKMSKIIDINNDVNIMDL